MQAAEKYSKLKPPIISLNLFVIVILSNSFVAESSAQDLVVTHQSGYQVTGDLDELTDENNLWIRKTTSQIILKSSYSWDELSLLQFQGNQITREALIQQATQIGLSTSKEEQKQALINFWFSPQSHQSITSKVVSTNKTEPNRVESLQMEAYVANWDRDAEIDGLMVHLYPLNAKGELVPIHGDVNFKLLGEYQHHRGKRWQNGQGLFEQLGSWQKHLQEKDLSKEGIILRLEFQGIHPMTEPDLGFTGLLTANLGVRGQGRFNASLSDVVLRPVDRFRDELQLRSESRSRYAPQENISPGLR